MPQQLLFKYRSLENWRFLLDILINNRLYAAPFKDLNDPMEGRYYYCGDEVTKAFRRLVRARKDEWRICSLTKDPTTRLMWSYYSGGHTGVALGLTVPHSPSDQIRDVYYDSQIEIGPSSRGQPAREVALDILSQKQLSWSHERRGACVLAASIRPYSTQGDTGRVQSLGELIGNCWTRSSGRPILGYASSE